jgi:hypothetical protein
MLKRWGSNYYTKLMMLGPARVLGSIMMMMMMNAAATPTDFFGRISVKKSENEINRETYHEKNRETEEKTRSVWRVPPSLSSWY